MTTTLATAVAAALPSKSPATQRAYGRVHRDLNRWAAESDSDPLTLEPEDLRRFVVDVTAGRSRATVAQIASALRFLYDAAIGASLRHDNPATHLRVAAAGRSSDRVARQPLEDDVIERVRRAASRLGGAGTRDAYPRRVGPGLIEPVLALHQHPDQRLLSPGTTVPDARYIKKLIDHVRLATRAPADNLADALGVSYEYRYQQWLHMVSLREAEVRTYAQRCVLPDLQPLIAAEVTSRASRSRTSSRHARKARHT